LDHTEEPHVIAAMLTYLYTLDYQDDGGQLIFGVPEIHSSGIWQEQAQEESQHERVEEENSDDDHSDGCSSEFAFIPNPDDTLIITPRHIPDSSRSYTESILNENQAEPGSHQPDGMGKDPSCRPSPLQLHIQMYKAALRFGIPCLSAHSFNRFGERVQSNIETAELLEAVSEVFAENEWQDKTANDLPLVEMRQTLVQAVRRQWNLIKKTIEFEDVVVQRPEFGKELLRLL
jgi:hypothetical protein